ncbi:multicopper oxidase [Xylaria bambusicola]|uniref:multicopper oxidase n=1 Tax=Xylaria bambusicola TaxID=326684 RepID=UPI002007A759|nr:multicopper oxidase [Xylaria bambusicola]KAI0521790.1 multicopper oxidase [Xylaria bambusicola]
MHIVHLLSGLTAIAFPALVAAAPASSDLSPRQSDACEFDSATAPNCWGEYSLDTNWYEEAPDTGVIREYWFEVVNKTLAPDGVERMTLSINGSIPGPTIEGDWGDTFVIHVKNSMENNGTSIHWHGIRQLNSSEQDGVASITQCPVAPGDSMTYRFRATQYGSTWYHSHFSLQAWNGVFGGVIIHGPASAPYNEDKGIIALSDWFHRTTDQLYATASSGAPPTAQNGLINGLNVYDEGGSRFETNFESGKSYRLRLVNTAIDTMFRFGIDNHTLTVIASDLVPIVPYETDMVNVAIGQRYDVIVKADQEPGNYWMRAIPQITCTTNEMTLNIKGIVTYDDLAVEEPVTEAWPYDDSCEDELTSNLVPHLSLDVGAATSETVMDVTLDIVGGFFKWKLNDNTFLSDWGEPTLEKVLTPGAVFTEQENIINLNETNTWTYLVVESQLGLAHPVHLHGHDFFVLAQEPMATFSDDSPLNLSNPPRRDVAMLPAFGYLAIAFTNDNPGVWLAHCHIGWHTSQGFALQLVERNSEIGDITDLDSLQDTCAKWNDYQDTNNVEQEDSGV